MYINHLRAQSLFHGWCHSHYRKITPCPGQLRLLVLGRLSHESLEDAQPFWCANGCFYPSILASQFCIMIIMHILYIYIYYIIYGLFEYMLHHVATYILMCVAYFFIRYPSTLYLHQQYYYPFWGRLSPGLGRVHSKALRRSAGRPPTDSVDSNRCLLVCVFDVNVVNHMVWKNNGTSLYIDVTNNVYLYYLHVMILSNYLLNIYIYIENM